MSTHDTSNAIPLCANYYLFGVYYEGEFNSQTKTTEFPSWHSEESLVRKQIANIRPLAKVPMLNVTDSDSPKLWATDHKFKLCSLGNGKPDQYGAFEVLTPEHTIHALGRDLPKEGEQTFTFRFPPLPLIASLSELNPKELATKVAELSSQLENSEAKLTLTEVSIEQLAKPYEPAANGGLSEEQAEYNKWYEDVSESGETLKGFVLPVVASCAVVFSDQGYESATVTLQKFDSTKEGGEYKTIGSSVQAALPEDELSEENAKQYPCAMFHVDPADFKEGLYSIRVEFIPSQMKNGVPQFIKDAHIQQFSEGLDTVYTYELREQITFSSSTPLGKFAIVSGDMISLEESLIYQYPQYFGNMKHYLHGNVQGVTANTPASRSIALLKNIRDVSAQLGAGLLSGSLQDTLDRDGRQAVFNNVSKLYWDAVKSEMPPAMKAAGELYYGIYSTKEALDKLQELHTPAIAGVGWKALFHDKVFNTNEARSSALALSLESRLGNRRVVAGRVAEAWLSGGKTVGFNGFGTGLTALSLYKKAKQLVNQNKKVDKAEQGTKEVTKDYLAQIPVWKTANHIQEEKLEQALKDARDQSGNQIDAILVNSSRGAGIKIEFAFNSREKELKDHAPIFKQLAASLANVLENEPNLRVEIEGHACQVGTEKANMQVSAERAEYAKKLLMKEFPVFEGRVSVAAFGESKPVYVPKQGEKVDRNNPNLRQNRRVVIRIYLQSLNIFFHPSRYGSHAMERSRLALEAEMVAQDKAEVALRMAIFDSVVDVASYIPAIAPAARGFMLAIEGSKTAISAVKVIDSLMLDSFLEELKQSHEVVSELERLAKIHIELLNDLRRSKVDVGIECRSYQELITHLESEEVRKEVLKRYQLRALAINGLVLLLADLGSQTKRNSNISFRFLVERYKVKKYIENYILSDDWSVHTIKGNTLAANWKNRCDNEYYTELSTKMPQGAQHWPAPITTNSKVSHLSITENRDSFKASGAFNQIFPIQTMLFEHPNETMFDNFTESFNPQGSELKKDEIGYCRILVQSARYTESDEPEWMSYDSWIQQSSSSRLGPYDKVKVQLILKKEHKYAKPVTIGYDRVDGLENIKGPAFSDWMLPMKVSDFKADPDGRVSAFYKQQGIDDGATLIAIEHIPSFRFGDVMIDGMKPMTSKAKLMFSDAMFSMVVSGAAISGQPSDYFAEADSFKRYVKGGGFQNMRYCLGIRTNQGQHSFYLPQEYSLGQKFDDAEDELQIGALSTETRLVLLDTYLGEQQLRLREQDLMVESFTLMASEGDKNTIPILHGIKQQVVAIDTKASGLNFFSERKWYQSADNIWRDGFSWGNKKKDDPASIYVLILGESHEKALYERLGMPWEAVNMCIQLALDGNDGKPVKGPLYFTDMYHIGEFAHKNEEWMFTESISENHREQVDAMSEFIGEAVGSLTKENELSKSKNYTMYCMRFNLEYVAPTGVRLKGLRPFGGVIGGKANLELSVAHLKQVGLNGADDYDIGRDAVISIPSLNADSALAGNFFSDMPWLIEKESTEEGVDKSAAETWKQYNESQRKKWLKDWIEKQPAVTQAPKPLEKSLDNPS
ncbi:OmpA family protein [Vibrio alginolyticus]